MSNTETNELLHAYLSTVEYKPPHINFDQEQYERDIEAGLIPLSRNANNHPYFPEELKAAHNAATLNVLPAAGKKRVVIATTIAYNWPAAYIERCFEAFCVTYDLWQTTTPARTIRPTIEVINLASYAPGGHGNPPISTNPNANQNIINALDAQINGTTNGAAVAHITTRDGLLAIPTLNDSTHTDSKHLWLGELLLNFWAIAMNPNAHFRVICGASAIGYDLNNTVVYASTDSNFASNPYGTTDYVNMSWGDAEFGNDRPQYDDVFFTNPRICYFGAAGNDRWAGYPATSSNVMCVGGASLFYNPGLAISAANNNNPNVTLWVGPNGSGGGTGFSHSNISEAYVRPPHQFTSLTGVSNFNNGRRVCPDICSLADPVTGLTIITANNTGTVKIAKTISGGTSLATPLMCGLFSHLSQRRINEGLVPFTTRLNDIGAPLYSLSGSINLQKLIYDSFRNNAINTLFHDIPAGGSTLLPTGQNYGPNSGRTFTTGTGYDIATGLGFARMLAIENALFSSGSGSVGSVGSVGSGSVGSSTIAPTNVPGQQRPRIVFNINTQPQPQ
jgi:hypothetical protein